MGFLIKLAGKKIEEIEYFLDIVVENIIEGKVIAFPTNSVYGLGCDPTNLNAIEKIYEIKFQISFLQKLLLFRILLVSVFLKTRSFYIS
jgi:tRNA A37 threonylcarbamoyladenosine synthetase subunit TsaC/SUA5/YrdC